MGSLDDIISRLYEVLPAFAIFGSRFYAHHVLLQLALFCYWEHNGHPVMRMLQQYPHMMSGENIELLNRLLAQHTVRSSRRSEFELLNPTYKSLGIMLLNGLVLSPDFEKVVSLKKGRSHFTFSENDPKIQRK